MEPSATAAAAAVENPIFIKFSTLFNLYVKRPHKDDRFRVYDVKKKKELLRIIEDVNEDVTNYLGGILNTLKRKLEKLHVTFLNDLNKCSSELDINEDPLIDMKNTIKAFCNEYMPLLRHYNFFLFGYASTATEILLMETFHPEMTIKELFPPTCAINYEMDIVEKNILLRDRFYFFDKKMDNNNKVSLLSYSGLILINEFLKKFNYYVTVNRKESAKPINSTKSEQNIEKIRLLFNNTANYLLPDIKYGELNSNSRSTTPTKSELLEYNSCFHTIYVTSND